MICRLVRPLTLNEHRCAIDYFHDSSDHLLETMGIDRIKIPPRKEWYKIIEEEFTKDLDQRKFFFIGWVYDKGLIGHSSISKIKFGDYAHIHLHIWKQDNRKHGLGAWFFKHSVNYFFEAFELRKVICEPYAENDAPNRVLQKLGFLPVRKYLTIPGIMNFEQYVNRYEIEEPFELLEK